MKMKILFAAWVCSGIIAGYETVHATDYAGAAQAITVGAAVKLCDKPGEELTQLLFPMMLANPGVDMGDLGNYLGEQIVAKVDLIQASGQKDAFCASVQQ